MSQANYKKLSAAVVALPLLFTSSIALSAQISQLNSAPVSVLKDFAVEGSASNKSLGVRNADTLKVLSVNEDSLGNKHTRYVQQYNGIPVWGNQVILHERANGQKSLAGQKHQFVTGTLVKNISEDVQKGLAKKTLATPEQKLAQIKNEYLNGKGFSANKATFQNEKAELVYVLDKNQKAVLAYSINFFVDANNQPARPYYLIDAESGKTLQYWDGLTHEKVGTGPGGNEKIHEYRYELDHKQGPDDNPSQFEKLDVTVSGSTCSLENEFVKTINNAGLTDEDELRTTAYSYNCYEQDGDAINGAYSPLNDAHFFGGVIHDFYTNWYGVAPLKFQLVMNVHIGNQYENAYWNGSSMNFGDGASMFYPLTSLDVAGHEISHGFTEQHSDLIYRGQSGGINEAFSDMAGKTAELYMRGSHNWNIGQDITKSMAALRFMDDPTKDGSSIDNAEDYRWYQDVHYTSGVYNKLFYLMSTTDGWDTKKAFHVMVKANSDYWTPNATFATAGNGLMHAAEDLGYSVDDVVKALGGVGIHCVSGACASDADSNDI